MNGRRTGVAVLLALGSPLFGCGSDSTGSNSDGPRDAASEAAPEMPAGGGDDAGVDHAGGGGNDAATDGGPSDATTATDAATLAACSSLVNPLYVMSGDTQVPILKTLGKALRQDASPMTIVWQATGSCTIIDAVYNGTPLRQNLSYIPADPAWDPTTGTVPTCAP